MKPKSGYGGSMKQYAETEIKAWLDLPLTQTYLHCLRSLSAELTENIGKGQCLDPASADHTFASYNQAIGKFAGLACALDIWGVLSDFDMVLEEQQ